MENLREEQGLHDRWEGSKLVLIFWKWSIAEYCGTMKNWVYQGAVAFSRNSPVSEKEMLDIETGLGRHGFQADQFCSPKYVGCSNLRQPGRWWCFIMMIIVLVHHSNTNVCTLRFKFISIVLTFCEYIIRMNIFHERKQILTWSSWVAWVSVRNWLFVQEEWYLFLWIRFVICYNFSIVYRSDLYE